MLNHLELLLKAGNPPIELCESFQSCHLHVNYLCGFECTLCLFVLFCFVLFFYFIPPSFLFTGSIHMVCNRNLSQAGQKVGSLIDTGAMEGHPQLVSVGSLVLRERECAFLSAGEK